MATPLEDLKTSIDGLYDSVTRLVTAVGQREHTDTHVDNLDAAVLRLMTAVRRHTLEGDREVGEA